MLGAHMWQLPRQLFPRRNLGRNMKYTVKTFIHIQYGFWLAENEGERLSSFYQMLISLLLREIGECPYDCLCLCLSGKFHVKSDTCRFT